MEATFFIAPRTDALGVASVDELPTEPAAEPLRLPSPLALRALAALLGEASGVEPLRDATCQSFPVWAFAAAASRRWAALEGDAVDALASAWQGREECEGLGADLYELCTLLSDVAAALRGAREGELFVLLEEKAL